MENAINVEGSSREVRRVFGDYICPVCGTKVIGGDHSESECKRIKKLKEDLSSRGHRIEAC